MVGIPYLREIVHFIVTQNYDKEEIAEYSLIFVFLVNNSYKKKPNSLKYLQKFFYFPL